MEDKIVTSHSCVFRFLIHMYCNLQQRKTDCNSQQRPCRHQVRQHDKREVKNEDRGRCASRHSVRRTRIRRDRVGSASRGAQEIEQKSITQRKLTGDSSPVSDSPEERVDKGPSPLSTLWIELERLLHVRIRYVLIGVYSHRERYLVHFRDLVFLKSRVIP